MTQIFDPKKVKQQAERAQRLRGDFFLHTHAAATIQERLLDIKRDFERPLLLSAYQPDDLKHMEWKQVYDDILGLEEARYDLIISLMHLHKINDVPGAMVQIRRALKPDGAFLFAIPGANTMQDFKTLFMQAETESTGGAAARFHPMIGLQQMAGLMQRAGFALPVVDEETLTLSYSSALSLLRDIRSMGEGHALYGYRPRPIARKVMRMLESPIDCPLQIIYGIGWSPHSSQQKPLQRGSGKTSLTDVLS